MKVLIIGAGNQGVLADAIGSQNEHKVISFAHAFKEREAELYFYDNVNKKAFDAFHLWGGVATTPRYALEQLKMDIVVITTPDHTHYEQLIQIATPGYNKPKLVICEKPLCSTAEQAQKIVNLYSENGIPILVNYTRRFIPELIHLKNRYDSGEFGNLETYQILYNRGDLHTGTHAIDFMSWFLDGKADESLKLNGIKDNVMFKYCDYRVWNIQLFFQKHFWQEQRILDMPVPSYFDYSTRYVVENAYNFLAGEERLRCTDKDALKALVILEELIK